MEGRSDTERIRDAQEMERNQVMEFEMNNDSMEGVEIEWWQDREGEGSWDYIDLGSDSEEEKDVQEMDRERGGEWELKDEHQQ